MREKIHAARLVANLRGRRHPRPGDARRLCQRLGLPQYWVLWLAAVVAVALVAVALVVSHGGSGSGQGSCTASWSGACTAQAPAQPSGSKARKAASGQSSRAGQVPAAGRASSNRPALLSLRAGQMNRVNLSAAFRMPASVR